MGPKILGRTYSRMLPVCFSEKASLEKMNTTAVHSSAGSQALRRSAQLGFRMVYAGCGHSHGNHDGT